MNVCRNQTSTNDTARVHAIRDPARFGAARGGSSIATPVFRNSFAVERLRKAADAVSTAWSKARLEAMRSGQTHVFRFDYGSNTYAVALWETGDASIEASEATTVAKKWGRCPATPCFTREKRSWTLGLRRSKERGGQTAPQIFFYPDGTTSTAQVLLSNGEERFLHVDLRGLTGIARASEVMSGTEVGLHNYGT